MNLTVCDVCKKELDEYAINIEVYKKYKYPVGHGIVAAPIGGRVDVFEGHLCNEHWEQVFKMLKEQGDE